MAASGYRQVPSALRNLTIFYDESWYHLSGRVVITLLNLMQLQSLRCLQPNGHGPFDTIIDQAIGQNVKHLSWSSPRDPPPFVRLPHPSLQPVYLDSLSIDDWGSSGLSYGWPTCRIQISRLQKLVVRIADARHHTATRSLLQSCRATLQDFEIIVSGQSKAHPLSGSVHPIDLLDFLVVKQDILATPSRQENIDGPIDLGNCVSW